MSRVNSFRIEKHLFVSPPKGGSFSIHSVYLSIQSERQAALV